MARFDVLTPDLAQLGGSVDPAQVYLELGIRHAAGRAGAVDLVEAHKWFNIAAIKGCREAAVHRGQVAAEMSPAQIVEAQRAARAFLTLH